MWRLVLLVLTSPAWAGFSDTKNAVTQPGAQFMSGLQQFERQEDADRFHETSCKDTFVFLGCLGTTAASLTHTPTACTAYEGGYRLTEIGSIAYANNQTCWAIYNREITGDLVTNVTFTRVLGTHYLVNCTTSVQPTLPDDAGWLMKVVTAAGSITSVVDLRDTTLPGGCGGGGFECSDINSCPSNVCAAVAAECPVDVCATVAADCPGSVDCAPPYCNVKCFGAVGDGTTDDTAAFQAATNACVVPGPGGYNSTTHQGCRGGGTVFIPRGAPGYKITGTITSCGVSYLGEGYGSQVRPTDFGSCAAVDEHTMCTPVFRVYPPDDPDPLDPRAPETNGVAVRDLAIVGPYTTVTVGTRTSSTDAIWYDLADDAPTSTSHDLTVDRVHITGMSNGLVEHALTLGATITRSSFTYNYTHLLSSYCAVSMRDTSLTNAAFAAIETDSCSDLLVDHCQATALPYFLYGVDGAHFINVFIRDTPVESAMLIGNGLIFVPNAGVATSGDSSQVYVQNVKTQNDPTVKIGSAASDYTIVLGDLFGHNEIDATGFLGTTDSLKAMDVGVTHLVNLDTGDLKITANDPTTQIPTGFSTFQWHVALCDVNGLCTRNGIPILTDNSTTPSVAGMDVAFASNSSATVIVSLLNGRVGQPLTILFTNGNTTVTDGGTLRLNGNMVGTPDDSLTLRFTGSNWIEVARSVN